MTVSYSRLVANGSSFGCFWSILFKWRGSVYKLVWRELLVYLLLYYSINFTYRFALNLEQQKMFEAVREYFLKHAENIPMTFVLAFYVSLVVKRWWEQYRLLPWPDTLALFVSAAIPGVDERGRLMRRNIVRYAVLAYVITLKHVSVRVKKRFPTLQHIVDAGLMMESEKKIFELMDERHPMAKYWLPLTWATNIINRARKENMIPSDHMVQTLLLEMSEIRQRLGSLIGYDNVTVPLVYTQVVTLSVYIYFLSALMGRQFVENHLEVESRRSDFDLYFPFFTALQFCFYIGWLKVAEVLIGPFGEDDDDIELNWLIDRHIKAAYMIVDEMHEEHPELLKDQYWDDVVPKDLPYTVASEHYRKHEPKGSAEFFKVKDSEAIYANLNHRKSLAPDDVYADYESVDTPVPSRKNWFQRQMQRMGSVRSSSTTYSSGLFVGNRTRHNSVYSSPDAVIIAAMGPGNGVASGGGAPVPGGGGAGGAPGNNHLNHPHPQSIHKMSIYDRLIGRKSTRRGSRGNARGPGKLNVGGVPATLKNRPRIPTPDVSKESAVTDKDNKVVFPNNNNNNNNNNSIVVSSTSSNTGSTNSTSGTVVPLDYPSLQLQELLKMYRHPLSTNPREIRADYRALWDKSRKQLVPRRASVTRESDELPEMMLSPIQETDGNQSTITSTGSSTATLATALLPPALTSAGLSGVITAQPIAVAVNPMPMMSVNVPPPFLNSLFTGTTTAATTGTSSPPSSLQSAKIIELPSSPTEDRNDSACGSSSGSTASNDDRSRKTSVTSQRRGEVYV